MYVVSEQKAVKDVATLGRLVNLNDAVARTEFAGWKEAELLELPSAHKSCAKLLCKLHLHQMDRYTTTEQRRTKGMTCCPLTESNRRPRHDLEDTSAALYQLS